MAENEIVHSMDLNTVSCLVTATGSVAVALKALIHMVCRSRNRLLRKSMAQA